MLPSKTALKETTPGRLCAEITAATSPVKYTSGGTEVVGFEFVSVQIRGALGGEQLCSPRLAADDLKPVLSAALCHLQNLHCSVMSCCGYLAIGCVAQL